MKACNIRLLYFILVLIQWNKLLRRKDILRTYLIETSSRKTKNRKHTTWIKTFLKSIQLNFNQLSYKFPRWFRGPSS